MSGSSGQGKAIAGDFRKLNCEDRLQALETNMLSAIDLINPRYVCKKFPDKRFRRSISLTDAGPPGAVLSYPSKVGLD